MSINGNDPSGNVLDLVEASNKRQDDLRAAESRHVREVADLRAGHAAELRQAETLRINAIRAVDVGAVQRAAEVGDGKATALAAQVAAAADAMRTQVAAAATAATGALAAALEPIQNDIQDLRRAQYEAQGVKAQAVEGRQVLSDRSAQLLSAAAVAVAVLATHPFS